MNKNLVSKFVNFVKSYHFQGAIILSLVLVACEEPYIDPPLNPVAFYTFDTSNFIEINHEKIYHINTGNQTHTDSLKSGCWNQYYKIDWWNESPYFNTKCVALSSYKGDCHWLEIHTATKDGTKYTGSGNEIEEQTLYYTKDSSEVLITFKNAKMYPDLENDSKYFLMSGRLKLNLIKDN